MEPFKLPCSTLSWLRRNALFWKESLRGIERESLRITSTGGLAPEKHPHLLGSALTHPWWTTDYAENLLELRTDPCIHIPQLWSMLGELHGYLWYGLNGTQLWPYSMPPELSSTPEIALAHYGRSPLGRFKHIYREGLRSRYGDAMQLIGGIHYNFSFGKPFLKAFAQHRKLQGPLRNQISTLYLDLIRNYYRVGWILPYLIGATPILPASLQNCPPNAGLRDACYGQEGYYCWPHATSLRLTPKGYYSPYQKTFFTQYNELDEYIHHLRRGTTTPLAAVWKWSTPVPLSPLNDTLLQLEDEFYAPIRPKGGVALFDEVAPSQTLERTGIHYVEVRAVDLNPFEAFGISLETSYFIELLLLWCLLSPSPRMKRSCMKRAQHNWQLVARYGRLSTTPLRLNIPSLHTEDEYIPLVLHIAAQNLLQALISLAEILDTQLGSCYTEQLCTIQKLQQSKGTAQTLEQSFQADRGNWLEAMLRLSTQHSAAFQMRYRSLSAAQKLRFKTSVEISHAKQRQLEAVDGRSFEKYLERWKITTQQLRARPSKV